MKEHLKVLKVKKEREPISVALNAAFEIGYRMGLKNTKECKYARPILGQIYCDIKWKQPTNPDVACIVSGSKYCPKSRVVSEFEKGDDK